MNRLFNSSSTVKVTSKYGSIFNLIPTNYIDHFIVKEGYYESEIIEAIKDYNKQDFVFWDIGSNIGIHATTVAKLFPKAEVFAFEPLPAAFQRLTEHININKVKIKAFNIALMDTNDSQNIYTDSIGIEGQSTLQPWDAELHYNSFEVECKTAQSLINSTEAKLPNIIKIDVEGSDLHVFKGFGEHLSDSKLKLIIFEAFDDLLERKDKGEVYELLAKFGFQFKKLKRVEQTQHLLANFLAFRS